MYESTSNIILIFTISKLSKYSHDTDRKDAGPGQVVSLDDPGDGQSDHGSQLLFL
jgi:hypothetical protein